MLGYTLRRLAVSIPLLAALAIASFFYVHVLPGDPVSAMLGVNTSPQLVQQLRHEFGLDRPLTTQFADWVTGLLHGNLGLSFRSQLPVTSLISGRIPAALELALSGLVVMIVLGVGGGLIAGLRRGSRLDGAITGLSLLGLAVPAFTFGALLVTWFAIHWRLLPSGGYVPFSQDPVQSIRSAILPGVTLGVAGAPYLARLTRSATIEVVAAEYVRFARARGLPRRYLLTQVVLRNVLPRLAAAIALTIGFLLGGSIVVEQLFTWPGTGQLAYAAVQERDYTMIEAITLLYGGVFIVVNLLGELAQGALDPRIRQS
jgi:peptide/nickel transport system permease protein